MSSYSEFRVRLTPQQTQALRHLIEQDDTFDPDEVKSYRGNQTLGLWLQHLAQEHLEETSSEEVAGFGR